jgi:hypothetical protein
LRAVVELIDQYRFEQVATVAEALDIASSGHRPHDGEIVLSNDDH